MATLKISDLSVGDWVQDNYGNYSKVEGIWQGCNFSYQVDLHRDGVIGTIAPCNIHPIPITPEILEANGFEPPRVDIGFDTWFWSNKQDMALELRRYVNDKWHLAYQIKDKAQAHLLFPLYHIHELQHIIRLLHIDKEIVMPNK